MKLLILLVVILLGMIHTACLGAPPQPEPKDVLAGPYELGLSVEPKRCHPHDDVTLTIEFRNTGTTSLLVPMRQDLKVEFKDSGAESFVLLPPTECSGSQYARIEPGKSLTYLRGVKVPSMRGVVEVHVLSKSVPLEITEANHALVPTHPAVAHGTRGDVIPFPPTASLPDEDANNRLPKLIEEADAVYPPEVKSQQLDDEVYVAFVVEKTGTVTNVRAFFSRHGVFEEAAVAAVKRWKFSPGLHEGHIVRTRMVVPILFKAEKHE